MAVVRPRGAVTPIVALDVSSQREAVRLLEELDDLCRFYKIGSELFTAEGASVVRAVQAGGASVFLDLKFHDIPNTVRKATRSAAALGVRLLTVHASGGRAMIEAAVTAATESGSDCRVLAVTVLTSMDAEALSESWGRDIAAGEVRREVLRLAGVAAAAGAHGVVCAGTEAAAVRESHGGLEILVPGIRLPGADPQDQSRVVTPREAADAGASFIVAGRTVTAARSPRTAMKELLADLP